MAEFGGENTLIKIAIFCIAVSVMSTCMFTFYAAGSSDYGYDAIKQYKSELVEFSGGQLTNDTPWVLSKVFTPFTPGSIPDSQIPNHIEDDHGRSVGWLFGEDVTTYSYIGEASNIKLDPNQKSNQLLRAGEQVDYQYQNGMEWWAGNNDFGIDLRGFGKALISLFGNTPGEDYGVTYTSGSANNWNYTGYRYVFDPVLPFNDQASTKDGRLSLVWYQIENDSGLSGALEVYGTSNGEVIRYGEISSADIVTAVQSTAGYVQVFDFNFEGTHLNLTIRFDPTVYSSYNSLQAAWDAGAWSMAISSASAGNFFDVENSNAFNATAGSALETFIDIFTFNYTSEVGDSETQPWVSFVMWMIVGLPMTLALLFITIRLVGGVFKIF